VFVEFVQEIDQVLSLDFFALGLDRHADGIEQAGQVSEP
jgi:hypothetical protein